MGNLPAVRSEALAARGSKVNNFAQFCEDVERQLPKGYTATHYTGLDWAGAPEAVMVCSSGQCVIVPVKYEAASKSYASFVKHVAKFALAALEKLLTTKTASA